VKELQASFRWCNFGGGRSVAALLARASVVIPGRERIVGWDVNQVRIANWSDPMAKSCFAFSVSRHFTSAAASCWLEPAVVEKVLATKNRMCRVLPR
jgi:hypothetical protein